jgi:hypothetical protein
VAPHFGQVRSVVAVIGIGIGIGIGFGFGTKSVLQYMHFVLLLENSTLHLWQ